jgi:hypothetical protein
MRNRTDTEISNDKDGGISTRRYLFYVTLSSLFAIGCAFVLYLLVLTTDATVKAATPQQDGQSAVEAGQKIFESTCASRSCWTTHRLVGCGVTFKCRMRRRSWLMMKKQSIPESDCWHGEEVHRGDGFPMVAEKCKPVFHRRGISRCFAYPTGDGSLGNIKSEHEKFTMNPGRSPGRIFGDHFEHQIATLLRDSTSATAWAPSSRQNPPVQLKSRSVPVNNGFGTDEDERLLPIGPDLSSGDPEQVVE